MPTFVVVGLLQRLCLRHKNRPQGNCLNEPTYIETSQLIFRSVLQNDGLHWKQFLLTSAFSGCTSTFLYVRDRRRIPLLISTEFKWINVYSILMISGGDRSSLIPLNIRSKIRRQCLSWRKFKLKLIVPPDNSAIFDPGSDLLWKNLHLFGCLSAVFLQKRS